MQIRLILFSFFLLTTVSTIYAQDIILKVNGDEIQAKIIEVDADEVKYKRFDNESGPVYSLPKSDIFMIKYENGEKDVFVIANPSVPNSAQYHYKNPVTAAWLSLMVPGLGQFYNEQKGKGIAMCALAVSSYGMVYYGMMMNEYDDNRHYVFTAAFTLLIGTYLWSIIDAAVSANAINGKNQALSWNLSNDRKLSITPDVLSANQLGTKTIHASPAYGFTLKLDF